MMLCGKHYIFAAGADLMQVPLSTPSNRAARLGPRATQP